MATKLIKKKNKIAKIFKDENFIISKKNGYKIN